MRCSFSKRGHGRCVLPKDHEGDHFLSTYRKNGLVTLAVWKILQPRSQGFVLYMEGEHPGSELKGQKCPYEEGTKQYESFMQGQQMAVIAAQDSEE